MKYSIEKDPSIGNYLVYRISFFGLKKKCIARMNTLESANTLVSFLKDPSYCFKNQGCNETTIKQLRHDLFFIARNMFGI